MPDTEPPSRTSRYPEEEVHAFPCVVKEHYIPIEHAVILALQIAPRDAVDRFLADTPRFTRARHVLANHEQCSSCLCAPSARRRTLGVLGVVAEAWQQEQASDMAPDQQASRWFEAWRGDPETEQQRRADLKAVTVKALLGMNAQLQRLEKRRDQSSDNGARPRYQSIIDRLTFLRAQHRSLLSPRQELWLEEGVAPADWCQFCLRPLEEDGAYCALCEAGPLCERCCSTETLDGGTILVCRDLHGLHGCPSEDLDESAI
jgi:hypothetical protein